MPLLFCLLALAGFLAQAALGRGRNLRCWWDGGAWFYRRKLDVLAGQKWQRADGGWIRSRLSAGSRQPFLEQEVSEPRPACGSPPGGRMLGVRLFGARPPSSSTRRALWYLQWKTPYKSYVLLFIITVLFSPRQPRLHCSIFPLLRNFLSCLRERFDYPKPQQAAVNPIFLSSGIHKCVVTCAKPGLHTELPGLEAFSLAAFQCCVLVNCEQIHSLLLGTQQWGKSVGWEEICAISPPSIVHLAVLHEHHAPGHRDGSEEEFSECSVWTNRSCH